MRALTAQRATDSESHKHVSNQSCPTTGKSGNPVGGQEISAQCTEQPITRPPHQAPLSTAEEAAQSPSRASRHCRPTSPYRRPSSHRFFDCHVPFRDHQLRKTSLRALCPPSDLFARCSRLMNLNPFTLRSENRENTQRCDL